MDSLMLIGKLFAERGTGQPFGQQVCPLEHALQTARLAVTGAAPDALVVAALLHDIGHIVHATPESIVDAGFDTRHEEIGQRFLSRYFGSDVVEPVRLHVAAKRYLCAVDELYAMHLSDASIRSLALQGGPMRDAEAMAFAENPYASDALALRVWDDEARQPRLNVPPLSAYLPYLRRELERAHTAGFRHGDPLPSQMVDAVLDSCFSNTSPKRRRLRSER
jgi:phosphonate degradation associated HDIG domain protein